MSVDQSVYEEAFSKYGDDIFNKTLKELADEYGKNAFPTSWGNLVRSMMLKELGQAGSKEIPDPDEFQLWELTEGPVYEQARSVDDLKAAMKRQYNISLLKDDEWENLLVMLQFAEVLYDLAGNLSSDLYSIKPRSRPSFKGELGEMAPAIKWKPGSRWAQSTHPHMWSQDSHELMSKVLSKIGPSRDKPYKKVKRDEWKVICSQLGEFRKDELLDAVYEMGLRDYISAKMKKKEICDVIIKFFKVMEKEIK